ncbi:hypothetical protein BS50DRAFT_104050 [Corynespora cassiicola Philippines]|uniref:Uncharacterized protein n=1 Tax=Corynespora cassiicola Philippines TaxID=1448308 RepID=A0A2T2NCD1_CORCC|nr:hypothetical protein BS50DRAFT_104050 [Corynespora cassiicola Philippines]
MTEYVLQAVATDAVVGARVCAWRGHGAWGGLMWMGTMMRRMVGLESSRVGVRWRNDAGNRCARPGLALLVVWCLAVFSVGAGFPKLAHAMFSNHTHIAPSIYRPIVPSPMPRFSRPFNHPFYNIQSINRMPWAGRAGGRADATPLGPHLPCCFRCALRPIYSHRPLRTTPIGLGPKQRSRVDSYAYALYEEEFFFSSFLSFPSFACSTMQFAGRPPAGQ